MYSSTHQRSRTHTKTAATKQCTHLLDSQMRAVCWFCGLLLCVRRQCAFPVRECGCPLFLVSVEFYDVFVPVIPRVQTPAEVVNLACDACETTAEQLLHVDRQPDACRLLVLLACCCGAVLLCAEVCDSCF